MIYSIIYTVSIAEAYRPLVDITILLLEALILVSY